MTIPITANIVEDKGFVVDVFPTNACTVCDEDGIVVSGDPTLNAVWLAISLFR